MGTPDFATSCLKSLVESDHEVCAVFTQPDKPRGRKMIMTPPDVKVYALEQELPVYQPTTLKNGEALNIIKGKLAVCVIHSYRGVDPFKLTKGGLGSAV